MYLTTSNVCLVTEAKKVQSSTAFFLFGVGMLWFNNEKISIWELSDKKWKLARYSRHQLLLHRAAKFYLILCCSQRGGCFSCSLTLQWLQELVKNTLNWSPFFPGHTYLKAKSLELPIHIFYVYCRNCACNENYMYYVLMHKLFH